MDLFYIKNNNTAIKFMIKLSEILYCIYRRLQYEIEKSIESIGCGLRFNTCVLVLVFTQGEFVFMVR